MGEAVTWDWLSRACVAAAIARQHPRNMPTTNHDRRNTAASSPLIRALHDVETYLIRVLFLNRALPL